MRLNQFLARSTNLSRRAADAAISAGLVEVNGAQAVVGQQVEHGDQVRLEGKPVQPAEPIYLSLNKPPGYTCSRRQQGNSPTIYQLLPARYRQLHYIGRLDKDSCGLLVMTNDGNLSQMLAHPSSNKEKTYRIILSRHLDQTALSKIRHGVELEDGVSRLKIEGRADHWQVRMLEGRNRQIRRTFAAIGYEVTFLQRTGFGKLKLGNLNQGACREIKVRDLI